MYPSWRKILFLCGLDSRVIVSHLKEFNMFKEVTVWHIPHEYSDIMQQPSKEVCLNATNSLKL